MALHGYHFANELVTELENVEIFIGYVAFKVAKLTTFGQISNERRTFKVINVVLSNVTFSTQKSKNFEINSELLYL